MEHKDKDKQENLEFPDQKIVGIEMRHEVENSFIAYSMSVIMSRALPDVRDGLKPVHRRILYAMYEDHLTYDKAFRKSATTVGNVLGRYHPHGDSAVYDTMVRLAQPFSMRYPLIEGHGNFGSVDGDPAAAYRYTEARLAKLSNEMMSDIDKNVVDFDPNFDNRLKEPRVLPSRFPNLLGERLDRYCCRYGDIYPSAQPRRGHRRNDISDGEPGLHGEGPHAVHKRTGFPDRGDSLRLERHI